MPGEEERSPILIDTDAFIAVANTDLWDEIVAHIPVSTTNVVKLELERHREENREFAPEGSREHRLHHGASRVLDALENDDVHFTVVTSVPRPHGPDAGEASLQQELNQNLEGVDAIVLMDRTARHRIRKDVERKLTRAFSRPRSSSTCCWTTDLSIHNGSVKRAKAC